MKTLLEFSCFRAFVIAVAMLLAGAPGLIAQIPPELGRERSEYLAWLETAPNSPLAALAQRPVEGGVRLGPPDADIPLAGLAEHRLIARGGMLTLQSPSGMHPVSPGRPIRMGRYTMYLARSSRGMVVTVFGAASRKRPPGYYEHDPSLVFTGPLLPPEKPVRVRVLAADGIETEATEAGSVRLTLGSPVRLRVLRIPSPGGEESELEIFFRDPSNGHGSYPAGRFVSLIPLSGGKYRLDLNRARNPFCAYNSVYPCPAPWRGNTVAVPVHAGERYHGGGLDASKAPGEAR
jgi:hypothetical protein